MATTKRNNLLGPGFISLGGRGVFQQPCICAIAGVGYSTSDWRQPALQVSQLGLVEFANGNCTAGFYPRIDRLMQVSADYGVVVAVFVGTLALGFAMAKA